MSISGMSNELEDRDAAPASAYSRFVIVGKARCGSTLLRTLLNSHSQVIAFGELFRDADAVGWDFAGDCGYRQDPDAIRRMRSDPVAFLQRDVFREFPPHVRAVGFKMFYYHGEGEIQESMWRHMREHGAYRIIHLKRNNLLRQFLSLKRAEKTDEWYRTAHAQRPGIPVALEVEELLRDFEYTTEAQTRFDQLFEGLSRIDVVYENLVAERSRDTRRIQQFLGLDMEQLSTNIVKQANEPLSAGIENYSEIRHALRGTAWEVFLDG